MTNEHSRRRRQAPNVPPLAAIDRGFYRSIRRQLPDLAKAEARVAAYKAAKFARKLWLHFGAAIPSIDLAMIETPAGYTFALLYDRTRLTGSQKDIADTMGLEALERVLDKPSAERMEAGQ